MESIIVGTDGSPSALAAVTEAGRLAAAMGRKVVVVSAYAPGGSAGAAAAAAGMPIAIEDGRERADEALQSAADRLHSEGVECDVRAVCGSPAEALIDMAALEHASMIVVGSRGMRGVGRVLGSVPNTVSHRAPCSVTIVRTD